MVYKLILLLELIRMAFSFFTGWYIKVQFGHFGMKPSLERQSDGHSKQRLLLPIFVRCEDTIDMESLNQLDDHPNFPV